MRVLFFTAAAVAACMANLGQAVRLEDNTVAYYDNFAEQTATAAPAGSDVKVAPPQPTVGSAAPAETAQEKKARQDKELVNNAVQAATKAATPPQ